MHSWLACCILILFTSHVVMLHTSIVEVLCMMKHGHNLSNCGIKVHFINFNFFRYKKYICDNLNVGISDLMKKKIQVYVCG